MMNPPARSTSSSVVVIGDSAVGKSNLLSRYARNEFSPHSKGNDRSRVSDTKHGDRREGGQGADLGIRPGRRGFGLLLPLIIEARLGLWLFMILLDAPRLIASAAGSTSSKHTRIQQLRRF
ncbi:unnamed protein product [Rhodiola kirilowii]